MASAIIIVTTIIIIVIIGIGVIITIIIITITSKGGAKAAADVWKSVQRRMEGIEVAIFFFFFFLVVDGEICKDFQGDFWQRGQYSRQFRSYPKRQVGAGTAVK